MAAPCEAGPNAWQGPRGAWLWPADGLPDDDATVLLRVDCLEFPVCVGFRDAGDWRDSSAALIVAPVLGWVPLHWAAFVLDTNTGGRRA